MPSDPMTELIDRILWPKIDDATAAKRAARQGAYYAFLVVALYTITALRSLTRPVENLFRSDGADAYAIKGVFLLVIGYGIFRLSRTAAVIGLIEYLGSIAISIWSGHFRGIVVPFWMVFALFFVNSVRGTYAYRRFTLETRNRGI